MLGGVTKCYLTLRVRSSSERWFNRYSQKFEQGFQLYKPNNHTTLHVRTVTSLPPAVSTRAFSPT